MSNYAKCLTIEKREELGWKSPFEIYFGQKSNELANAGRDHDNTISIRKTLLPKEKDFQTHSL